MAAKEVDISNWSFPRGVVHNGIHYPRFPEIEARLREMISGDVLDFDVLVATFPRSGTARLIEIVWLLLHNCDVDTAKSVELGQRHAFFEMMRSSEKKSLQAPVVAKTHVDFNVAETLVKRQKKVVVGIRNPKDSLVSFYHFYRMNVGAGLFPGSWHQFFQFYLKGETSYGDFFDNVLSWWEQRDRENIMIVRYEDLNENPLKVIKEMAAFLGQMHTEEKLMEVAEWTSFANMKRNPTTNFQSEHYHDLFKSTISPYMRKGAVGDWKNYFNEEESNQIDALCESLCKPLGLNFKFE